MVALPNREFLRSRVHYELIRELIETSSCPNNAELARRLDVSPAQVEQLLQELSDEHGIVLHPHRCEPWVVHPFSLTPTMHWVRSAEGSWWAPCVWCALGVAALIKGDIEIHSLFGAEGEPLVVRVVDGQPVDGGHVWVHFAIPPSQAWCNVHQHCSMVLAFRSPERIRDWCYRHYLPLGEGVPLAQVASLARAWYGAYGDADWHKWTISEAQRIFRDAGLVSQFWNLGERNGAF